MRRIFAGIGSTMASSSPETAPSLIQVGESPSSNSSNSNPSTPPPAEAASSPPPQSPPASPPPATTPTPSPPPSSPPPSSPLPASPPPSSPPPASPPPSSPLLASPPPAGNNSPPASPPAQSQSPPPDNSPPPSSNSPPPSRDSPPAPVFSPPPPGTGDSQSPPSPASSHPPPSPPRSGGDKSSGSSTVRPESDNSPPSSDSISPGAVAAIIVGGFIIVALLIVCVIYVRRRRKRPKYYMDPGHSPKGGNQYYNSNAQWNNRPQPLDLPGKLPPPPGGWGIPPGPPPPPPTNNSSEYSSGHSAAQRHTSMQPPSPNMGGFGSQSQFTYEELAYATGGFTQANLLGQGGFGLVHKGILPGGKEVAVKSLKSGSGQGEREFQAEVEIISRVHHRHLVSLVGYCIADGQKMLVYEFVPNKTLEFHLHGKGQPVMDWATRLRLALGSAKGLAYLHEDCHPRIIHRDIKAANILIDINFEAMVADFGLAKLTTDNNTHVSTRVMGTFGYLAPEYASSGKLSEKSDVFSFGVMLLELITGRRPVDPHDMMEDSLVDWARPLLTRAQDQGIYEELVDPRLEDQFVPREMARMVACAAASIRHSARRRPKMSQIVRALEGDSSLEDLNEIVKPSQGVASKNTEIYDTRAYDADMMKFRQMVMMTSQEFNSSEYGLNPSSSSSDSRETGKSTPELQKP